MDNKTIIKLLDEFGFLILNEHKSLPSLIEVDGTWGDMIELIRTRRIFLSKLIIKRQPYYLRIYILLLRAHL